ncbi:MAG: exopolysaccharide Pel transporter PelG [Burkholderiales bacterium]
MAGIGFEFRKLLQKDTYWGLFQAYTYSGIVSSGPWILSILGILIVGIYSVAVVVPPVAVTQFQVSVTYLFMSSLILTGLVQLAFTRYIADRMFEKRNDLVTSTFNGVLMLVTLVSGVIGMIGVFFLFPDQSNLYRLLMLAAFVILCCIWCATIILSGLKQYKVVVAMFGLGYIIVVGGALLLRRLGMEGLLLGFVVGHFVLLMGMLLMIFRNYPSHRFVGFDFLQPRRIYVSLMLTGLFYNLGIWIDKIMFWYNPDTGAPIVGYLHHSVIYDLPVFLAYLSIIPGMAVFLVRIETDFVDFYQKFYDAVREGGSLDYLNEIRDEMVFAIRQGIFEIIKIQGITVLIVFIAGPTLLRWIGINQLHLPLLYVQVVGASLQVVFLGLLNVFFYLDKRAIVAVLTFMFVALNVALTALSFHPYFGAAYYGYGYAVSLLICVLVAMQWLDTRLSKLEYETFMLQ